MKGNLTTTTTISQETKDEQGNVRNRHTVTSEYMQHSEQAQVGIQEALLAAVEGYGNRTLQMGKNKNEGKQDKDL